MYILIIDDNKVSTEAIASLFRLDGHKVDQVGTIAGVLERLDDPPDAVVLDYHLPDGNGLTLLNRLRDQEGWKGIPIVMVTGDSSIAAPKGPVGPCGSPFYFLLKPVTPEHIYKALDLLKSAWNCLR